ncbi:MAG: cupin domain-containing protein [Pseudomonadota bacterium]
MAEALTVIRHAERPTVPLVGGATYQPIVGDDTGAGVPVRTGIQVSPPGYSVPVHSHPYVEILTAIEGRGEVWLDGEDARVALEPGVSVMVPAHVRHSFGTVGDRPLVTLGIHAQRPAHRRLQGCRRDRSLAENWLGSCGMTAGNGRSPRALPCHALDPSPRRPDRNPARAAGCRPDPDTLRDWCSR